MVFIDGVKYACETCIRGHRVTTCAHKDRPLTMIKPKGRPVSQCAHCREARKTRALHTRCECTEIRKHKSAGAKVQVQSSSTCCCGKGGPCDCSKLKNAGRAAANAHKAQTKAMIAGISKSSPVSSGHIKSELPSETLVSELFSSASIPHINASSSPIAMTTQSNESTQLTVHPAAERAPIPQPANYATFDSFVSNFVLQNGGNPVPPPQSSSVQGVAASRGNSVSVASTSAVSTVAPVYEYSTIFDQNNYSNSPQDGATGQAPNTNSFDPFDIYNPTFYGPLVPPPNAYTVAPTQADLSSNIINSHNNGSHGGSSHNSNNFINDTGNNHNIMGSLQSTVSLNAANPTITSTVTQFSTIPTHPGVMTSMSPTVLPITGISQPNFILESQLQSEDYEQFTRQMLATTKY
ncbi:hypothetical protein V1511DRAFT_486486 [Dipodascopsis uninucleata]